MNMQQARWWMSRIYALGIEAHPPFVKLRAAMDTQDHEMIGLWLRGIKAEQDACVQARDEQEMGTWCQTNDQRPLKADDPVQAYRESYLELHLPRWKLLNQKILPYPEERDPRSATLARLREAHQDIHDAVVCVDANDKPLILGSYRGWDVVFQS